jgi:diaminohydroxyphosphoribosylaminopyrimidine deaminase/5-amino-6-(5-phosphoribosylamino)uracil reductase
MQHGRPWVRLKMAMSLDGRTAMASGESQWITGEEARADVHRWRARSSAVLTGVGTVLADDPRMTARIPGAERQPLRVVVDSRLRTPANARLFESDAPVLIATAGASEGSGSPAEILELGCADGGRAQGSAEGRAEGPAESVDLNRLMTELAQREINEVWVEAGARLSGALLSAELVDELIVYVAPRLLGADARALFELPQLKRLQDSLDFRWVDWQPVGDDLRLRLRPRVNEDR